MKITYKNVSQVIKAIVWSKKTKSDTSSRSVVFGSCSDLQDKTSFVAKVKILTNTTSETSCDVYLGCGTETPTDHISKFYGSPSKTTLDLTVNAVTEVERSFSVAAADISSNLYVKLGIAGASPSINNQLAAGVTFEVEYYFT